MGSCVPLHVQLSIEGEVGCEVSVEADSGETAKWEDFASYHVNGPIHHTHEKKRTVRLNLEEEYGDDSRIERSSNYCEASQPFAHQNA